jgi:hypothetical protein
MNSSSRSLGSRQLRRPLIKAMKGMLAASFLGGCRLGNPSSDPWVAGLRQGGATPAEASAGLQDGGVPDAAAPGAADGK